MKTYTFLRDDEGRPLVMGKDEAEKGKDIGTDPAPYQVRFYPVWGGLKDEGFNCALSILSDYLVKKNIAKKYDIRFREEVIANLPFKGGIITEKEIREFIEKEAYY